ncbi:MAG TPA: STAS domain-containing protein [Thermodesulfobacteriota bacterium]
MPLLIQTRDDGQVKIEGEMNIYNAGELKDGLMNAIRGAEVVSLDLSGVSEMDSAGLQVVLLAWREAGRRTVPFRLTGMSSAVESVLSLFDLKELSEEGGEKA